MTETLYDRLGGEAGVSRLVDRIFDLHLTNDFIKTRFSKLDEAGLAHGRAMAKQFFTVGSGGPGPYEGRSMPEAHKSMNIGADEYLAVVDDILQAMAELDYPKTVCDEVLSIAYSLKGEILRK
jgi:hemoglobin